MVQATVSKALGGTAKNLHAIIAFFENGEKSNIKNWEVFSSNDIITFGRVQISIWKMSLNEKNFSEAINFTTVIQKHWNQIKWIHNQVRKGVYILNLTSDCFGGCGWGHTCFIPMKLLGYVGNVLESIWCLINFKVRWHIYPQNACLWCLKTYSWPCRLLGLPPTYRAKALFLKFEMKLSSKLK